MLTGSYDLSLVLISFAIAILAAYTALDLAGRIGVARRAVAPFWVAGAAVAMGVGIWSMHFVGMLAFSLPIAMGYELDDTLLSLLAAILGAGLALWLVGQPRLTVARLFGGALSMAAGIGSMHYLGMHAMAMQPGIEYDGWLVTLSLLVALFASTLALFIGFLLRRDRPRLGLFRALAALLLGGTVVAVHYIGMAAANFPLGSYCAAAGSGLDSRWLASLVIIVTLAVLAIALLTSVLDARLEARTAALNRSLARANQEMRQLALHDNLTQLPNRLLLEDRIQRSMEQRRRNGGAFALMFLDLDGFKLINDAFGHHIGDLLLRDVASRLRGRLRDQDTLARVGGDEFVLLAELGEADDAAALAQMVVGLISQPFQVAEHELRVSTSIGIALYPRDGANQQELLMNADAAMYHAKDSGKNGFSFFQVSMNTHAREQLQLTQQLRVALQQDQFVLHYQPKFDARSGQPLGAEALLRWEHPQHGLLAPDAFIGLAERTGLILDIDDWVLHQACRQVRDWRARGHGSWRVAVNLSAQQFRHVGLVSKVALALAQYDLPANCLTLEITETTAMTDLESSLVVLRDLAQMGVDLAIDDFGSGYSSLLYLKRLPAHELKIDRGFVRDLQHDGADAAIISAIVALGRALGLRIVAEGVETLEQQRFLTELGCDALQGYRLGMAMPAERLLSSLENLQRAVPEPV